MFISQSPTATLPADRVVLALRAAGESTRLRILALLAAGDLSVGELASALGQSQPRVSRHLKLMSEAGLIERLPEGASVYYRLTRDDAGARLLADAIAGAIDAGDPGLRRDAARLADIRAARDAAAQAYFEANAADWDRVRRLHLPDADIESAMREAAGPGPFGLMVDVGVGAGRMIEAFADRVVRAEGFDLSPKMLAVARAALDALGGDKAAVRLGDIYDPPIRPDSADLVTVAHVLRYLADPARAVANAVRLLKPGGVLLITDFAAHDLEFLRERHAHRRLGFADDDIQAWCAAAGAPATRTIALAPSHAAANALTVKIWRATRLAGVAP